MKEHTAIAIRRDAAIAAAAVIIEEFFPHCPNGLVAPIGERLCEIVTTAIDVALAARTETQHEPSSN